MPRWRCAATAAAAAAALLLASSPGDVQAMFATADERFAPLLPAQFDCKVIVDVGYEGTDHHAPLLMLMHADLANGRVREDYYRLPASYNGGGGHGTLNAESAAGGRRPEKVYTTIRRFDEERQFMAYHRQRSRRDGRRKTVGSPRACFITPVEGLLPERDFLRRAASYLGTTNFSVRTVHAAGAAAAAARSTSSSSGGGEEEAAGGGEKGKARISVVVAPHGGSSDGGGSGGGGARGMDMNAGGDTNTGDNEAAALMVFANAWEFEYNGRLMRLIESTRTRLPLQLQLVRGASRLVCASRHSAPPPWRCCCCEKKESERSTPDFGR
jgi:hypothetical protein